MAASQVAGVSAEATIHDAKTEKQVVKTNLVSTAKHSQEEW